MSKHTLKFDQGNRICIDLTLNLCAATFCVEKINICTYPTGRKHSLGRNFTDFAIVPSRTCTLSVQYVERMAHYYLQFALYIFTNSWPFFLGRKDLPSIFSKFFSIKPDGEYSIL